MQPFARLVGEYMVLVSFVRGHLQRVYLVAIWACALAFEAGAATPLPICPGDHVSDAYELLIDGQQVPVGNSEFNGAKTFHVAAFEAGRTVPAQAKIRLSAGTLKKRRPGRSKQDVKIENNVVEFQILPGEKLVLESTGAQPLFLFALPEEKDAPNPGDAGVVYFGPGEHEAGEIRLKSGTTLYLAAGARVKGRVYAFEANNVAIRGRGVLDARGFTDRENKIHGVLFERCRNVAIEGVQIRTGDWWQVLFLLTDNARVEHLHTLSFGRNNDGVDTDGVTDLRVRDSFIGCGDDGFGIHAVDAVAFGEPITRNCVAERCVIWNEHAGNGLRIGASTETGEIRDIVFRSIDVLRCANNAIMIDHSDWAVLRRIVFDDFDNDTPKPLANIAIMKTHYSNDTGYRNERGKIEGLLFRNVRSAGGGISIRGFDQDHAVRGVGFMDCRIQDRLVRSADDVTIGQHVFDVSYAKRPRLKDKASKPGPTSTVEELILDNDSANSWAFAGRDLETISSDFSHGGTAWRFKRLGRGHAAVYQPNLEGTYEVSVYWDNQTGLSTAAPWTVHHKQGYTTQLLDQNQSIGWHHLGEFELDAESWVRLVNPHYPISDGPMIADAVRFRRVATPNRNAQRD